MRGAAAFIVVTVAIAISWFMVGYRLRETELVQEVPAPICEMPFGGNTGPIPQTQ